MYKVFLNGANASMGLKVENMQYLVTLIDIALKNGKRIEIWEKEENNEYDK